MNARDAVPQVPQGKVRIADPGTYDRSLNADHTVIARGTGALHGFPTVTLTHVTRGYVIAGSMMRWDEVRWSVTWQTCDGSIHGRSFLEADEEKARAYFAEITDYERVSRMRQENAMRDDMEREEREACAAEANAYTVEAAKTYRSGWQYRADYPGLRSWCGFEKTKRAALEAGRRALEHAIRCHRADKRAA